MATEDEDALRHLGLLSSASSSVSNSQVSEPRASQSPTPVQQASNGKEGVVKGNDKGPVPNDGLNCTSLVLHSKASRQLGDHPSRSKFRPLERPLSRKKLERTLPRLGLYSTDHEKAFISEENDSADTFIGSEARKPPSVKWLRNFEAQGHTGEEEEDYEESGISLFRRLMEADEVDKATEKRINGKTSANPRAPNTTTRFRPAIRPPWRKTVTEWAEENDMMKARRVETTFQKLPQLNPETTGGPTDEEKDVAKEIPDAKNRGLERTRNASGQNVFTGSHPSVDHSNIEGPTLAGHGFKCGQETALGDVKAVHEASHVTVMSIEVHCITRNELNPDPEFDPISAGKALAVCLICLFDVCGISSGMCLQLNF